MKRFSANWREGTTHQRTYIAVVDSTLQDSKVRRIRVKSYAGDADRPQDEPEKFVDALYSRLGEGMEPERAIAMAEADFPISEMPQPKLLTASAVANFDNDREIVRAVARIISRSPNATSIVVSRM